MLLTPETSQLQHGACSWVKSQLAPAGPLVSRPRGVAGIWSELLPGLDDNCASLNRREDDAVLLTGLSDARHIVPASSSIFQGHRLRCHDPTPGVCAHGGAPPARRAEIATNRGRNQYTRMARSICITVSSWASGHLAMALHQLEGRAKYLHSRGCLANVRKPRVKAPGETFRSMAVIHGAMAIFKNLETKVDKVRKINQASYLDQHIYDGFTQPKPVTTRESGLMPRC